MTDNALRGDTIPLPRFRDKVAALQPGEPLQLVFGDVTAIAEAVDRHKSTVQRAIEGGPHVRVSAELLGAIESAVGVPVGRIRLVGYRRSVSR